MLSQEKNCGQNATRTAVITAASTMFTTSATVAISETERFVEDAPNTRVMRTVDAVPMADSAMVTILSICKALPTAAAGSVPSGASMNWLTLPIMICINSSTNSGRERTNTSLLDVRSAGARPARAERASRRCPARSRAPDCARMHAPAVQLYAARAQESVVIGSHPFRTRVRRSGRD